MFVLRPAMWPAFSFHGRWRPRIALLAALFGCIVTACLYVIVSKTTGATAAAPGVIQIKLSVDPATLQLSGACRIVAIHGLGSLDGDYILADEPTVGHERWHGVSMSIQNLVLSYLAEEGVWSIGAEDWNRAFLNGDPGIPPAQSSQWQIYNTNSSVFEDVGGVVSISCPREFFGISSKWRVTSCMCSYTLTAGILLQIIEGDIIVAQREKKIAPLAVASTGVPLRPSDLRINQPC